MSCRVVGGVFAGFCSLYRTEVEKARAGARQTPVATSREPIDLCRSDIVAIGTQPDSNVDVVKQVVGDVLVRSASPAFKCQVSVVLGWTSSSSRSSPAEQAETDDELHLPPPHPHNAHRARYVQAQSQCVNWMYGMLIDTDLSR